MFFSENVVDTQLLHWSEQLLKAILAKRKIRHDEGTVGRWAKQYLRLVAKKYGHERVGKVLEWYCQHVGEQFVPLCLNAEAFRIHFLRLEQCMVHADDTAPAPGQEALLLAERLKFDYRFPVEIEARLPVLAQLSRDNWLKFWQLMHHSYTSGLNAKRARLREVEFLQFVLNSQRTPFVEAWLVFLSRKFHSTRNYTSAVLALAFRPSHPWFQEHFWWQWSREWSGDHRAFDGLLEQLLKGEQV